MKKILSHFETGGMTLPYLLDSETQNVGFTILPCGLEERFTLEGTGGWNPSSR